MYQRVGPHERIQHGRNLDTSGRPVQVPPILLKVAHLTMHLVHPRDPLARSFDKSLHTNPFNFVMSTP